MPAITQYRFIGEGNLINEMKLNTMLGMNNTMRKINNVKVFMG